MALPEQRSGDARADDLLGVGIVGDDVAVTRERRGVEIRWGESNGAGQLHRAVLVRVLEAYVHEHRRVRAAAFDALLQFFLGDARNGHGVLSMASDDSVKNAPSPVVHY